MKPYNTRYGIFCFLFLGLAPPIIKREFPERALYTWIFLFLVNMLLLMLLEIPIFLMRKKQEIIVKGL